MALSVLPACIYRINIQQGNYLDQETVSQIEPGMTRSQVRFILGTPMISDSFHQDRWDYVYYFRPGKRRKHIDTRRFIVYFDGDQVSSIVTVTPE